MKKAALLIISGLIIFPLCGCGVNAISENSATMPYQETATFSPSEGTTVSPSQTEEVLLEPEINLEYNVYNDDGSVKIDVYVNDTLMDVKVFADDYEVVGPYNFTNYTLADPIMNFLNIEYTISKTNDSVMLSSEKYSDMEFTYVGSAYREDVTMIDGSIYIVDGQLYLPFWVFRVYTNGSLKQDDSKINVFIY